jgi:hypothetical protein
MFRWFNNLTVKLKLASGFGLVLLLTLLIALTGWINLSNVISRGDKLGEISELIAIAKDLRIARLKFQSTRAPEDAKLVIDTLDKLDQRHQSLKAHFTEEEDRRVIDQQHELSVEYRQLYAQLLKSFDERDAAKQVLIKSASAVSEGLQKAEQKLVNGASAEYLPHLQDLARPRPRRHAGAPAGDGLHQHRPAEPRAAGLRRAAATDRCGKERHEHLAGRAQR